MSNQAETETVPNMSAADFGRKAVEFWRTSDRDGAKGDALAIFALEQARHTMTFEATVKDRKGNVTEHASFDLMECAPESPNYVDPKNENGSRNIKLVASRINAVSARVFGVENPETAFKQRIMRALKVIAYFERLGLTESAVSLSKRNELIVPYTTMHSEPGEDATTNDVARYEALKETQWAIDGKHGNSLAELTRRAVPPKARGAQDSDSDASKVVSFVNSVKFVQTIMVARNDDTSENTAADNIPAFSGGIKQELWNLYQSLATYFEADPIDENETTDDGSIPFKGTKAA